jgi:hypothetical protein
MKTADEGALELGRRLVELRGSRSQESIAKAMRDRGWKWSQAAVWGVETGQRHLKLQEAEDLAAVLRVNLGELLGTGQRVLPVPGVDVHASPEAEERAAAKADNPALATETIDTAERRNRQGWPWPVSGDATALLEPGKIPWGVKRRGRIK